MITAVSRHPRRAFAAVTAIVLIGLVASTLAALAMIFTADARRTVADAQQAQLRQFLIAGAADIQHRLNTGQTTFDLQSPVPAGGAIHLAAQPEGAQIRALVTATLASRRAAQTLRFVRDADRWKLASVEIGGG